MLKEVPVFLVKANQSVLVLGTALGILLQNVWLISALFVLMLIPLLFGAKYSTVFRLARKLFPNRIDTTETQAAELLRFNQSIATVLLGLSTLILWVTGHWSGYLFAGMVTVAASIALAGFCVGCFMYFQWKQWSHRMTN